MEQTDTQNGLSQQAQSAEDENATSQSAENASNEGDKQKKRMLVRRIVTIAVWVVLILIMIYLVLFCSYKIGQFDSIPHMFDFIRSSMGAAVVSPWLC